MAATIDKVVSLTVDRADRLASLARSRGASEDILVGRALDLLFAVADDDSLEGDRREWHALGMEALERVWDNEADSAYDGWRRLYGVAEG